MITQDVCAIFYLQADLAHWKSKSDKRQARLGYQHVSKEFRTQHVLVHNQMNEGMEDRLKQMEESFQKEAAKISKERDNLKQQQQDLVHNLMHYIFLTKVTWFIARISGNFRFDFRRNLWCSYCEISCLKTLFLFSQEETRKAVEEVKLTLTAQLKATKQMVADASLTAQGASRLVIEGRQVPSLKPFLALIKICNDTILFYQNSRILH